MSPTHSNPTGPRRDRQRAIQARAPYNFVTLPEEIVPARQPILPHNAYCSEGLSGWIECDLETCSPTYVRGMMTESLFKVLGHKKSEEMTAAEKGELAPFFALPGIEVEGRLAPVIPGSSLRGMIRSLVEIAGYGRIRWVAKEPTFTFRAVAAARSDPLSDPYRDVIGPPYKTNVRAGYLEQRGDDWYVLPASTPQAMKWPGDTSFLTVKEKQIRTRDIPGYFLLNSENYRPQVHKISFDIKFGKVRGGRSVFISEIGSQQAGYKYEGVLVCSGNMMEAGGRSQESPRRNHTIVMAPDKDARPLRIRPQSIKDYLAGLTPFQKEKLTDWGGNQWGCLKDGAPVFFVVQGKEVAYFGHSPNFRIPARLMGKDRAATPQDFVPQSLRSDSRPDLADAIFGWVEDPDLPLKGQQAGRVCFSDARYVAARDGVWLKHDPMTPHTLSGPKPTTFQHYLVQDSNAGHDPDNKKSLAHFGSDPEKTQIRGFKMYWHKGDNPDIEADFKEREHESQLTRILPVKPGVRFSFKIHFENLREEELGALWWTLTLPDESGRTCRHKLGMGKPLGMGAVAMAPRLFLTPRQDRYKRLFNAETWHEPVSPADAAPYLQAFETYILKENGIAPAKDRLSEVARIQMLLTLLEWHEGDPEWLEETRYMEIERGLEKVNEYKERPVLPDPLAVVSGRRWLKKQPTVDFTTRHVSLAVQADQTHGYKHNNEKAAELRMGGRVHSFDEARGYGVIKEADGSRIFVHRSDIRETSRKHLRPEEKVSYTIGVGLQGHKVAKEVEVEE